MFALPSLILLPIAFFIYRYIASYLADRRFQAFAESRGCQSPYAFPPSSLLEKIRFLHRLSKLDATGEDIMDDIVSKNFEPANTNIGYAIDGTRPISTCEPANIQAVLATQFSDYVTGALRHRQLGPLLGRSIFSSDGTAWEHSRALFRPQFARENINNLQATEEAAMSLIRAMGSAGEGGWTEGVDLMPLFFNFTLDTASEFLFGESVGAQAAAIAKKESKAAETGMAGRSVDEQFREDLNIIGATILTRIRLQNLYWLGDSIAFRRAIGRVRKFVEHFVRAAVDSVNAEKSAVEKETLLQRLATQTRDRRELRDQTLAILFAGRDTTAALLGWCFVRLALHPDIFQKLRGIILREFDKDVIPSFAQLKGCRYLQHFINEVLRLHPTVPMNLRIAARDTTLPVGGGPDQKSPIAVRKGQVISFIVYFAHRRKDLWGEDAMEFKPERWSERVPAWNFVPFSGGPRICLGQQYALTEASYVLVRMLEHFDAIEPIDRDKTVRMPKGLGLTMWPADGVKVRLHRA